jgi:hypothetical protein
MKDGAFSAGCSGAKDSIGSKMLRIPEHAEHAKPHR